MDTIFCPWEPAKYFISSSNVPQILYYALIPGMLISLLLSVFVFLNNKKSIQTRLLLFISTCFFIWGFFNLILFATNSPSTTISLWALQILIEPFIYAGSLYLAYVFFDEDKDITFLMKAAMIMPLLPIVLVIPTEYNLQGVNLIDCTAIESNFIIYYSYLLEIFFALWILILSIIRFKNAADTISKKRILYFAMGILIFLLAFSSGNIIGSFTDDWVASQYGYFGMPVFMGFLAYLIVQYKAFNIKLLGARALVAALLILIASEFFYLITPMGKILTGITLALTAVFGWMLIKSVESEVKRKEELQMITDELAKANDQLRKLDNAKSEFISIASHQLRTPLTAIKGFISLLIEGSYGKVGKIHRDVLNKVFLSNERLIALVEDLLNLSRIESGRMEYNYEKVRLEDVCNEIIDTFLIRAKEKKLSLALEEVEKDLPAATTDRNKIREVISNLVDNALKYTSRGFINLKLSSRDGFVRLEVSDTGMGVEESDLESIFGKFSRGRGSGKINASGTGLGLHVGKSIMEAMGGRIGVESKGSGFGSTFYIDVPTEHEEE